MSCGMAVIRVALRLVGGPDDGTLLHGRSDAVQRVEGPSGQVYVPSLVDGQPVRNRRGEVLLRALPWPRRQ